MNQAFRFRQPATALAVVSCTAAIAAMMILTPAHAGNCEPTWDTAMGQPGINGEVHAFTIHNGNLIAGGRWNTSGGGWAWGIFGSSTGPGHVARWNGQAWQPLGTGMGFDEISAYQPIGGEVFALVEYNGDLVAGGNFTYADGVSANYIARWNGSAWQPLGSGMNNIVRALVVYNGELIASGSFTTAGGASAGRVARWNGSTWQPLGFGMNGTVNALTVHDGQLFAGGSFTTADVATVNRIARWNGLFWQPVGSGTNNVIHALSSYNGELIAGGSFTTADGVTVNRIARWDGSQWLALGDGVNGNVHALTVHEGQLIAGGRFVLAGGLTVNRIARWDGREWAPLDSGMSNDVNALTTFDDGANGLPSLYAGGTFTRASGQPAHFLARWDGAIWQRVGAATNDEIHVLLPHQDGPIIGGSFITVGGQVVNRIARWDGAAWQPMGGGFNGSVFALAEFNGQIIAGGTFTLADGRPANRIARWDGTQWLSLGSGVTGCIPGDSLCAPSVFALLVYNGDLIVGGAFTSAGSAPALHLARWDGDAWHPFGNLTGTCMTGHGHCTQAVYSLILHNDQIIAAGTFRFVDGILARNIARWDGASWQPLSQGLSACSICDPTVFATTVHEGDLIAAGTFTWADGQTALGIARWDGKAWHPLGAGVGAIDSIGMQSSPLRVDAVATFQGSLYIGGRFSQSGGQPAPFMARWDGQEWQPLGEGVNQHVRALVPHDGGLTVVGNFFATGSNPVNRIATLILPASAGTADLNCDNLVNGLDLGILLANWSIPPGTPGCNGATPCPADLNNDGLVNGLDLGILLANWTL